MKQYYTIYLGDKIWENVTDDMNTTEDWSWSGLIWKDRRLAEKCMAALKDYGHEDQEDKKFSIRKLHETNN